jgi:DnaJ-class molecular chaperone
MTDNKTYYEILGVLQDASTQEIKEAYLYKVNILHPDRLEGMSDRIRIKAEEELKLINEAYSVLSNPAKRRQYDIKIFGRPFVNIPQKNGSDKPPKPEIYPKIMRFKNGLPYVKQKGSFFVRNIGGYFSKVLISNPPSWVTGINTFPLQNDGKMPMRVDIEVMGIQWGKKYSTGVVVRLDDAEAIVKIELQMERKPHK